MEGEDTRLAQLRDEIRERLRQVCNHMPPEEFERLIESVARNARNSELKASVWGTRKTERGPPA